jgi:hypothetical protein
MKTLPIALAILVIAFGANAVTPTPSTKLSPSTSNSPAPERSPSAATPTPKPELAAPMEPPEKAVAQAAPNAASNATPPKPVLYLMDTEPFTAGGKNWIRLRYDVLNKADYPADMFAAAPGLPPCGLNTNASRTWVDFFDATGKRLYGFCALSKPADLGKIWFAYEEGTIPPSYVYIELNDRQTNTKYKSNLADTTL